jgi:hypothetical protein
MGWFLLTGLEIRREAMIRIGWARLDGRFGGLPFLAFRSGCLLTHLAECLRSGSGLSILDGVFVLWRPIQDGMVLV